MNNTISNLPISQLEAIVEKAVANVANSLQEACEALFELANRKVFHPMMRVGLFRYYKEIATGRLTALAATTFVDLNSILDRLVDLPPTVQDDIAKGVELQVVEKAPNRKTVVRKLPVLRMNTQQLATVFESNKGKRPEPTLASGVGQLEAKRPTKIEKRPEPAPEARVGQLEAKRPTKIEKRPPPPAPTKPPRNALRSVKQQETFVKKAETAPRATVKPAPRVRLSIDKKSLRVGNSKFSVNELILPLAELGLEIVRKGAK